VIGSVVNFAANGTVSEEEYHKQYQVYTWAGKYGLALSVAAWCWSLVSSIAIIRNVRKEPPYSRNMRWLGSMPQGMSFHGRD